MESRELTDHELECILWALDEAGAAEPETAHRALQQCRLHRFRPTVAAIEDIPTLIALVALRTRASGITLGNGVFIRADQLDDRLRGPFELIAHEAAHVVQFERDGRLRFLAKYIGSYLWSLLTGTNERDAYLNIPYEREARDVARLALERHAHTDR